MWEGGFGLKKSQGARGQKSEFNSPAQPIIVPSPLLLKAKATYSLVFSLIREITLREVQ